MTMQGYLEKESSHWKTYRKRWVVCKDNCLYSYPSGKDAMDLDDDAKCTEVIDLNIFEYIERVNTDQFKLISEDKKTTRHFIAPTRREMREWVNYIKHVSDIYELTDNDDRKDSLDSIVMELSEDEIVWNNSDKIWQYYWKSDGIKNVHGPFSCAEMAERYKLYFQRAAEPIMFRMVENGNWNFWADSSTMDIMRELRQYNVQKTKRDVDECAGEWLTTLGGTKSSTECGKLPYGWIELKDKDGRPYFHDCSSGTTQWQRPNIAN